MLVSVVSDLHLQVLGKWWTSWEISIIFCLSYWWGGTWSPATLLLLAEMARLVKCPSGAFHELTHILSPLIIAILFCDAGELNTFFIFQLPWCRIWGRVWESYITHLKSYSCLKIPAFLCELAGVYHMCDELVSFQHYCKGTSGVLCSQAPS